MPIRIKKPEFKPYDKKYRIAAAAAGGTAVLLGGVLLGTFGKIMRTGSKVLCTVLFIAFLIYLAGCITALVFGVKAYKHEDNMTDLGQCAFHLAGIIFCLMNFRFSLVLLFSAYGLENAAQRTTGATTTYAQFIESQYYPWVCIVAGLLLSFAVGIFAVVKLIKNRSQR